jgi:hypothetical protein
MTASYSSEECDLFAEALASAWEHLQETRLGQDEGLAKAALSHAILQAARLGERNKQVLVAYALAHMEPAKIAIQQRVETDTGKS